MSGRVRRHTVRTLTASLAVMAILGSTASGAGADLARRPVIESLGADAWAAGAIAPAATRADAVEVDPINAYLVRVYSDLFSREPDPAGLATWGNALRNGTPRRAVADAITSSDEFRARLVREAYQRFLGRAPEPGGLEHWVQRLRQGWTIQQLQAGILSSDEYHSASAVFYGATEPNDGLWLSHIYLDLMDREPDHRGFLDWVAYAERFRPAGYIWSPFTGEMRVPVVSAILASAEVLGRELDADYVWLLGRGIDPSGRTTWTRQLQQGVRYENVIGSIIGSGEYFALAQLG